MWFPGHETVSIENRVRVNEAYGSLLQSTRSQGFSYKNLEKHWERSCKSSGDNSHVNFGSNLLCKITLSNKMFLDIVRLKGELKKDSRK